MPAHRSIIYKTSKHIENSEEIGGAGGIERIVRSEIQEFTLLSREIQSHILIVFQDGLTHAWNDNFQGQLDLLMFFQAGLTHAWNDNFQGQLVTICCGFQAGLTHAWNDNFQLGA